jgi:hypothetical protein
MSAGVACIFGLLFGLAAAGIAEFLGGRAGFPVADPGFVFFVFLTACAGVLIDASPSGGDWFLVTGCWFWHCITLELFCYNYSYAHKSFKLLHPDTT